MTAPAPFALLDLPDAPARRAALANRRLPPSLLSHAEAARHYQPDADLKDAIHVALTVGAPLLLTGEPGTGKTQAAWYLAEHFGIQDQLFPLYVRSTHSAEALLYEFDAVAYLRAAHDPDPAAPRGKAAFVEKGPLWRAYEADGPAIVLIDEIDKAPRDFPNDLLNVLDKHEFHCPERCQWVRLPEGAPPPLVVITSNSEHRLPEAFLRRCVFHHLRMDDKLVERAVRAHTGTDFPTLHAALIKAAIARFWELRGLGLRKPPATAELLVWLCVLAAHPEASLAAINGPLFKLPALGTLVKDREDRVLLGEAP